MNTSLQTQSYRGRRVAIFGASGFLGAHLVRTLVPLAGHVVAFARGTASPALPALAGAEVILGDIRNRADVELAAHKADLIFMMAGRSGAIASVQDAQLDLQTNCGGLLNVLEAARGMETPPRIIFPGSRLQYGKVARLPVNESEPLLPLVPYGVHKTFCENYLAYYARRYQLPFGVVRLTNPYGPWAAPLFRGYNVLNLMVSNALANRELVLFGDGLQIRDYLYVDDAIDLLLRLGLDAKSRVINGGSGEGHSMVEVAHKVIELAGSGRIVHEPWPPAAWEVETGDFVADISRAQALGFNPAYSIDEGLRAMIAQQRAAVS